MPGCILKTWNKSHINLELIGGEPTLHPNLLTFCQKLTHFTNIKLFIYSNFSADINYYKQLVSCGAHLLLSWHSCCNFDLYKHKFSQFTEDELNHVTLAIMYEHNAIQKSLDVFDYFKITYKNFKNLEFSLLDKNENYNGYDYTEEQLYQFKLRNDITNKPIKITYNDNTVEYVNDNYFFKNENNMNFKFWLCNVGLDFLFIYCDGSIHICDEGDTKPIFNINTDDFNTLTAPTKQIFCRRKHCPCIFGTYKKYAFKK